MGRRREKGFASETKKVRRNVPYNFRSRGVVVHFRIFYYYPCLRVQPVEESRRMGFLHESQWPGERVVSSAVINVSDT